MDIDNESMEILMRYAREVQSESTINNAEYDHEGMQMRHSLFAAID